MKNSIKTDIKTWAYSGRALILLFSCLAVFWIGIYTSYSSFSVNNKGLLFAENLEIEKGGSEGLNAFLTIFSDSSENEAKSILNQEMLKQELKEAESNLHAINPKHALSYCMECGYYLLPVVLVIFGALTVESDMKRKILRLRVTREGKWKYFFGKQISMVLITLACAVSSVGLDYITSFVIYRNAVSKPVFQLIDITGNKYPNLGNSIPAVAFFALFIILFLEIGFCIGLISKSVLIPLGALFVFWYLGIFKGKFTPLNAFINVFSPFCDFQGSVHFSFIEIPAYSAWIVIVLTFAVWLVASVFVFKFRSAYK